MDIKHISRHIVAFSPEPGGGMRIVLAHRGTENLDSDWVDLPAKLIVDVSAGATPIIASHYLDMKMFKHHQSLFEALRETDMVIGPLPSTDVHDGPATSDKEA